MPVSVLLVSHNGERWLPAVLAGVEQQTHPIDHRVAIDTGSRDGSVTALRTSGWDVEQLGAATPWAESVRAGLARIPAPPPSDPHPGWVWILHDDSAPAPDALALLLEAAHRHPDVAVLGPKLREWPSLRRLLEMGVTISGTGRRETGLERGEYDQGQHDRRRVVLAVNTAGMLVRRDVLEHLGFDRSLPVYGNDLDFGWRAARAGYSTMVVPEAVCFHVEAAHRGQRASRLAELHHRQERAGAIYTLLANGTGRGWALQSLRLGVLGLLRALGFLLIRAPLEAWDELVALGSTVFAPRRIAAARRARQRTAVVGHSEVRHLLAPPWLPLRHLLDNVGDFFSALVDLGRESVGGRTVRTAHQVDVDDVESSQEPGLVALVLRSPRTWLIVGGFVLALVAARDLLHGGPLHGGALPAAPAGTGHWWSAWWSAHHDLGTGSSAPAPGYVLVLAVLGVLTLGHAGAVIWVLFVLGVPLTALSALRFFRRVTDGWAAAFVGATAYALAPVVAGAYAQGRLGTVVGGLLLPWAATSALGLARPERERRWRAVWRTAVGLALTCAFAPTAWLVALLVAVVLIVRRPGWWAGPVVVLVAPVALLLPWAAGALQHPGSLLLEAGVAGALPASEDALRLLLGRPGGPGAAPWWLGAGLLVAALLAGLREQRHGRVAVAWGVAAAGALVAALTATVSVRLPGLTSAVHPWTGFGLLVLQAGLVGAVVVAGDGLLTEVRAGGWRRPAGLLGGVLAAFSVVGGLAWWAVAGISGPLERGPVAGPPAYMSDLSATHDASGVLQLRGGRAQGVRYEVLRDGPLPVGDDAIAALTAPDPALRGVLRRLLADPQPADARSLAAYGVAYVYARAPVSRRVSAAFDAAPGFSRASGATRHDASWRLQDTPTLSATDHDGQPFHLVLVVLQGLAIVAAIVLTMPSRRVRR
ncbi:glycosyltransferase [Nocardioides mangrovicus]|uniref:glycosyltransferase n=1 Tax=Nocardioides mangrovicus TaxID=2478913 RepID=UPI0011C496EF|nr:glycosyltransferase [Nocardioides mangrovicus]